MVHGMNPGSPYQCAGCVSHTVASHLNVQCELLPRVPVVGQNVLVALVSDALIDDHKARRKGGIAVGMVSDALMNGNRARRGGA